MPIGLGQGWTYALSELPCQGCDADPLIWHSTKPTTPLFSLPHLHNGTSCLTQSPTQPHELLRAGGHMGTMSVPLSNLCVGISMAGGCSSKDGAHRVDHCLTKAMATGALTVELSQTFVPVALLGG